MKKLIFDILDTAIALGFIIGGCIHNNWTYIGIGAILINTATNTGGYRE